MAFMPAPVKRRYDARARREAAARTRADILDAARAADIVWATNATELYQLLVGQRGRHLAAPAAGRLAACGTFWG
jgi:hypothetical protein